MPAAGTAMLIRTTDPKPSPPHTHRAASNVNQRADAAKHSDAKNTYIEIVAKNLMGAVTNARAQAGRDERVRLSTET
jgi:hypothetical protein